ncbi:hypothetical protein ACTI_43950 [Actinoplanes sp. OR16]|nr:hypothetical protein ACTI_43950 [Actinoplanes sp. OR16]
MGGEPGGTARNAEHYVYTTPSRKAIQAIKDKVKARTARNQQSAGVDELLSIGALPVERAFFRSAFAALADPASSAPGPPTITKRRKSPQWPLDGTQTDTARLRAGMSLFQP